VCVFGGILWVFFNRQFDIYSRSSFEGAYKKAGVCTHHTHKSSSPRREFSRSLALGIGQIPPFSFPAREEPTHTRHWGKGSSTVERPSRPPPLFMGWVTKKKPKTTLLTYDPIPLSCVAGWLVGVHTPPTQPPSGRDAKREKISPRPSLRRVSLGRSSTAVLLTPVKSTHPPWSSPQSTLSSFHFSFSYYIPTCNIIASHSPRHIRKNYFRKISRL
jgi:hypothetical protein